MLRLLWAARLIVIAGAASALDYAVGQVWTYHVRPGEEGPAPIGDRRSIRATRASTPYPLPGFHPSRKRRWRAVLHDQGIF